MPLFLPTEADPCDSWVTDGWDCKATRPCVCKQQTRLLQQCCTRCQCGPSSKASDDPKLSCTDCCSEKEFDLITSTVRDELHWLPIVERIHFKQCMLVYRSLHGMTPSYIADMCVKKSFESEHYNLRSAFRGELVVSLARISTFGRRCFKYSDPSLWNALQHYIRDSSLIFSQFRSGLRTLLYREVYYQYLLALSWWFLRERALYKCRYLLTYPMILIEYQPYL